MSTPAHVTFAQQCAEFYLANQSHPNIQAKLDKSLSSIADPIQRAAIEKLIQQIIQAKSSQPMDVDEEEEEEEEEEAEEADVILDLNELDDDADANDDDLSDDGQELDEDNLFDVDQYIDPKTGQIDSEKAEAGFQKWRREKEIERSHNPFGRKLRETIDPNDLLAFKKITDEIDFDSKAREYAANKLRKLLIEMQELTAILQDEANSSRERKQAGVMIGRRCREIMANQEATDVQKQTAQKWLDSLAPSPKAARR
jgi:hypothetical protein